MTDVALSTGLPALPPNQWWRIVNIPSGSYSPVEKGPTHRLELWERIVSPERVEWETTKFLKRKKSKVIVESRSESRIASEIIWDSLCLGSYDFFGSRGLSAKQQKASDKKEAEFREAHPNAQRVIHSVDYDYCGSWRTYYVADITVSPETILAAAQRVVARLEAERAEAIRKAEETRLKEIEKAEAERLRNEQLSKYVGDYPPKRLVAE